MKTLVRSWLVGPVCVLLSAGPVGAQAAQASGNGAAATKPQQAAPPAPAKPAAPAAPAPAQAKPPAASPQATSPAAGRLVATVMVTDQSGSGLADVKVTATGPVEREGTTVRDGTLRFVAMKPGTYRFRFEAIDFITFEREVAIKAGAPAEIDASLNRSPVKPAAQAPSPAPAPVPAAPPVQLDPAASAQLVGLPDWVERNLIGRSDPLKETVIGRTSAATATVIQVRDPIKDRARGDADEMLYIVAGEGVLRSKGRDMVLDAGALVVLPRGVAYSIERRGRNPIIALSIVSK